MASNILARIFIWNKFRLIAKAEKQRAIAEGQAIVAGIILATENGEINWSVDRSMPYTSYRGEPVKFFRSNMSGWAQLWVGERDVRLDYDMTRKQRDQLASLIDAANDTSAKRAALAKKLKE